MFSFGVENPALGGMVPVSTARMVFNKPAIPAAALRCPIWLLIDPTATDCPAEVFSNADDKLVNSVASPTTVDVPWASINSTVDGS